MLLGDNNIDVSRFQSFCIQDSWASEKSHPVIQDKLIFMLGD